MLDLSGPMRAWRFATDHTFPVQQWPTLATPTLATTYFGHDRLWPRPTLATTDFGHDFSGK